MDFTEAENRFRHLEELRTQGVLTLEQYRAGLNQLRVTDAWGRLWMPQERTGQWHVYQNGQWIAAQPPTQAPPPPPIQGATPATHVPYRVAPVTSQPAATPTQGGGCAKVAGLLVVWAVLWAVVGVVIFFLADREPLALLGVGAAALLSLAILLATLSSAWNGTIVDVRVERERVSDGDDDWHWENVRYAYVRRASGRVKRMRAMPAWQTGDTLEKRRGDTHIRHIPRQ